MREHKRNLFISFRYVLNEVPWSKRALKAELNYSNFFLLIFIHFNFHFDISNGGKQSLGAYSRPAETALGQ